MIIQHNLPALNAHRQLTTNNSNVAKSLEKLSSGFRINKAADDAAGLAISEKMRGQISGLGQASRNAQDGISLIQTAEGALQETHAILQRMRELSVQSANGTYQDDVDRENIQKEVDALKSEIDRISTSTHYNGINLLDGSLGSGGASGVAKFDLPVAIDNTTTLTNVTDATKGKFVTAAITADAGMVAGDTTSLTVNYENADGSVGSVKIDLTYKNATTLVDSSGNEYTVASGAATAAEKDDAFLAALKNSELANDFDITSATAGTFTFDNKEAGTSAMRITSVSTSNVAAGTASVNTAVAVTTTAAADAYQTLDFTQFDSTDESKNAFSINGQEFKIVSSTDELANLGSDVVGLVVGSAGAPDDADVTSWIGQIKQYTGLDIKDQSTPDGSVNIYGKVGSSNGDGLTFQIGANGTKDQRVSLSVGNMSSSGIGVKNISVSTREAANKSIAKIDDAINKVSGTRADLGALQNRMEHTINSLGVAKENLTASESRIRDVDMASEMMNYTKNNILTQAAQAMLAQANTLPQGVLQLLG